MTHRVARAPGSDMPLGLLLLVVGLCAIVASTIDWNDSIESQQEYCRGVDRGQWPDYRGTYSQWCRSNRSPEEHQ